MRSRRCGALSRRGTCRDRVARPRVRDVRLLRRGERKPVRRPRCSRGTTGTAASRVRGRAGSVRYKVPHAFGTRGAPCCARGSSGTVPSRGRSSPRRDVGPLRLRLLRPHRPAARAAPGCDGVRLHARGLPPRRWQRRWVPRGSAKIPRRSPCGPNSAILFAPAGNSSYRHYGAEKGGDPRPGGDPHDDVPGMKYEECLFTKRTCGA